MSSRPELRLDWCSYQAAKYAVEHWHYSRRMPIGKLVRIGAWEGGYYIGTLIYSTGASPQLHKVFNLSRFEVCELVRVALRHHVLPVSQIVACSLRLLHKQSPKIKVVVSFADPEYGHIGTIYQAGGWVYLGRSTKGLYYEVDGHLTHNRNLAGPKGFGGSPADGVQKHYTKMLREGLVSGRIKKVEALPKYKYAISFDKTTKHWLLRMAEPYPKRQKDSSEPSSHRLEEGGAAPTLTLQESHATHG
tara:strand:- start:513 stop:1253 length:741 start_codon:yes stop_codon:yes gene_type:complete